MEIIPDYKPHVAGERETVNWTRPDGQTYFNVPIMYIRQVDPEEYFKRFPHMRDKLDPSETYFWEVSVD